MSDQYNETTQPEGEPVEDFAATSQSEDARHLASGEKFTPEKLGDMAVKFATETAYAAAGLADAIAARAKEFYEAQRKQLADKTPEGVDPNFRQFVDAMPDQFKVFMDEATKAYHEMAERGRHAVSDFQTAIQSARQEREDRPDAGAFDLEDDASATAEAADAVAPEEVVGEAPDASGQPETDAYPGEAKDEPRDDDPRVND